MFSSSFPFNVQRTFRSTTVTVLFSFLVCFCRRRCRYCRAIIDCRFCRRGRRVLFFFCRIMCIVFLSLVFSFSLTCSVFLIRSVLHTLPAAAPVAYLYTHFRSTGFFLSLSNNWSHRYDLSSRSHNDCLRSTQSLDQQAKELDKTTPARANEGENARRATKHKVDHVCFMHRMNLPNRIFCLPDRQIETSLFTIFRTKRPPPWVRAREFGTKMGT